MDILIALAQGMLAQYFDLAKAGHRCCATFTWLLVEPMSLAGSSLCRRLVFLLVAFSSDQELEVTENELLEADGDCQEGSSACALGLLQHRARQQMESLEMESFGENPSEGLLWQKFTHVMAFHDRNYGWELRLHKKRKLLFPSKKRNTLTVFSIVFFRFL